MVTLLIIHENSGWYYSLFSGSTYDELKKITKTERSIGPIKYDTYSLYMFYSRDKKKSINTLGTRFQKALFPERKHLKKIHGKIIIIKTNDEDDVDDVTYDEFVEVYEYYIHLYQKNKNTFFKHKKKEYLKCILQKIIKLKQNLKA